MLPTPNLTLRSGWEYTLHSGAEFAAASTQVVHGMYIPRPRPNPPQLLPKRVPPIHPPRGPIQFQAKQKPGLLAHTVGAALEFSLDVQPWSLSEEEPIPYVE